MSEGTKLIFLDSNIPMYLIGGDHPNKVLASEMIERLVSEGQRLVTDAEVFQEILHRYGGIKRPEFIEPAFKLMRKIVDEVFPVDMALVEMARSLLASNPHLSSRDALHAAAMKTHRVSHIATFDKDFDRIPGVRRISH